MTGFETAFRQIKILVNDFKENESKFLSPDYSEADVRKDFIDKFFNALGWDVYHNEQKNPYEQEVKIEKGVQVGRVQKRADYAFFLTPDFREVKFYVEAKKPARNLFNADDYFQTCRYGWNAGTQIAFLLDFEELHILDCRTKPVIPNILENKIVQYHYSDYSNEEKFAEIYWLLSREAVANKSLEKFAESLPKPRGKAIQKGLFKGGYQSIDDAFLEELDDIRNALAKSFKKANPYLESEQLTEMTQKTIDRLVFIRFLEDKLIEPDHYVSEFGDSKSAWKDFKAACRKLDAKYNGVVFKKHIVDDSKFIEPDDNNFSQICKELAHVNSPYNFDIIPIHILGSIYERFLGKVVIATEKRVRIEEKPEVRKAGGVYYTPQYIVNYIVDNTIGKLIDEKTPHEISKLKFADISCGSGSFLITVFDRLLEYHKKWYQGNPGQAKKDGCYFQDGKWILSLKQKQKILTNNIYGVDLDSQAKEVTQLSLYLKLLEDETTATANDTWVMFKEQLLPNLNKNIICGNSLIGTDILEGNLFGNKDELKLRPLNFGEAFPEVMKGGGFDAIVGNPPYGAKLSRLAIDYLKTKYATFTLKGESYILFIENAINIIKVNGILGYIIPDTYLNLGFTKPLRDFLFKNTSLKEIVVLPHNIFSKAVVDTTLLLTKKENPVNNFYSVNVRVKLFNKKVQISKLEKPIKEFTILSDLWYAQDFFNVRLNDEKSRILEKMDNFKMKVFEIANLYSGIKVYEVGKGNPPQTKKIRDEKPFSSLLQKDDSWAPFYDGKHIGRYEILWSNNNWIKYGKWLAAPREQEHFIGEKILIRKIVGDTLLATYTNDTSYCNTLLFILKMKISSPISYLSLLAILNSKLIGWYFINKFQISSDDTFPQIMIRDIIQFPIPLIESHELIKYDQLVEQIIETKKVISVAKTESEKEYLENKCSSLDRQIDNLVYELYGLNEEEIGIIEKSYRS
ncbi:MAG: TaqI-like C-terminal specificity domain-containing protein [Ignavibacteriaceae bacterium]|nr:TaqI-like C-terminal specificity domain-containing protein [Ignavibacteriaceae bacterium]